MGFGLHVDMASRPWRLSAKLLIISSIVTVICFSAICVNVMLDMRHSEEQLARQTIENLASSLDSDIGRTVEVYDLNKTILHLLGIDHTRLTYKFQGRDFRLTDVHGRVVKAILS